MKFFFSNLSFDWKTLHVRFRGKLKYFMCNFNYTKGNMFHISKKSVASKTLNFSFFSYKIVSIFFVLYQHILLLVLIC